MSDDEIIKRRDLQVKLGVVSETMRRWIKAGKLPEPDVKLSLATYGWKVGTLRAAGVNI